MRLFCFSGSGNSYWAAKEIGAYFSTKPELITCFMDTKTIEVTDSQVGIVAPVYLNDIPKIVKEFVLKLSFTAANAFIFAVLTSSSGKNKNGFSSIDVALAQHDARLVSAFDISMPSSFQERIDVDSVLSAASGKVEVISKFIEEKNENYLQQHGSSAIPKNFTKLSLLYKPLSRMAITDKCNGCGLCCKLCPVNNIELKNGKALRAKNCIACTACASWCPQHAISNPMLKANTITPRST